MDLGIKGRRAIVTGGSARQMYSGRIVVLDDNEMKTQLDTKLFGCSPTLLCFSARSGRATSPRCRSTLTAAG